MDMNWGDEKSAKFITNVGLVTSNGKYGNNIMACEWTHHVSYSPGLIAVCLGLKKATVENIRESKEFGISIAATDQNILSSVAGGSSGKDVDKIKVLEELGYKFYKGKKINALMVKDSALNVECKLVKEITLGDHIMFVGEVVDALLSNGKEPLAYHDGKYWKITQTIEKPNEKEREKIKKIIEKHKK